MRTKANNVNVLIKKTYVKIKMSGSLLISVISDKFLFDIYVIINLKGIILSYFT